MRGGAEGREEIKEVCGETIDVCGKTEDVIAQEGFR